MGNDVLDYLTDPAPLKIEDGYLPVLTGPGLGVDIDEAFVEEQAKKGHRWRNPAWRHEDGSVAEW